MRFRTVIANVALLHKIVRSLNALSKLCIIRLSPETVHFIVPGNEGREGVQVWSQVKVDTLFSGYRIESNNNNEIWLEIQVEALLRVLKSCESSVPATYNDSRAALTGGEVTLKLNRRQSDNAPIWAFEIKGQSAHGNAMTISHEVKIHILTPKRQQELNEPLCPPPDIHILLPSLVDLRNIVSRLGQMASDVKLSANLEGTLELSVDSRSVDLTTTWQRLHIPTSTADADQSQGRPKHQMYSTTVSIKALQKFLTSHLVGGTAIACICERHCVIAYVYIGDINDAGGVLTFFIPAKNVNPED